jgi:hypothetical protein
MHLSGPIMYLYPVTAYIQLAEVEQYIKDNGYLPDAPSEEVNNEGIDRSNNQATLL